MSILVFTWVPVALDVTLLVFLAVLWFQAPQMRSRLAVIVGALTPIYSAYAGTVIMYLFDPGTFMSGFAVFFMWAITFGGVVISLIFGVVMSGIPFALGVRCRRFSSFGFYTIERDFPAGGWFGLTTRCT